MRPVIAALLMFGTVAQRSFAYELTIGLAMLSAVALLLVASLDGAEEQRECDGPLREDAPECWDERE